jgi:hypothetical protein
MIVRVKEDQEPALARGDATIARWARRAIGLWPRDHFGIALPLRRLTDDVRSSSQLTASAASAARAAGTARRLGSRDTLSTPPASSRVLPGDGRRSRPLPNRSAHRNSRQAWPVRGLPETIGSISSLSVSVDGRCVTRRSLPACGADAPQRRSLPAPRAADDPRWPYVRRPPTGSAARHVSMNASTASRGLGGLKMAGCVAIRRTADSTGSNSATGSAPFSVFCSQA